MFKRTTFRYVLIGICFFILQVSAQVPIDTVISGAEVLSDMQNSAGDTLDILDSSQDLLEEIGTESSTLDSFSQNTILYNRELTELKNDLRDVGASEDYINEMNEKFNSPQSSLSQKMRSLRRALSSIKKLKRNILSKLSGKDGNSTELQKGILSTEQQALHLQIQNMQWTNYKNLQDQKKEVARYKQEQKEINDTILALSENKKNESVMFSALSVPGIDEGFMQSLVFKASVGFCVFAFILMMFTPFQSEAKSALKAALFGMFLSIVLPLLVQLYKKWLGI